MRASFVRFALTAVAAGLTLLATPAGGYGALFGQEPDQDLSSVPVDRWLITGTDNAFAEIAVEAGDPLRLGEDSSQFPDRNQLVGPGYWHLVRHDEDPAFDLDSVPGAAELKWAHVYVRVPEDRSLQLAVARSECGRAAAWFNGQPLHDLDVRTAGSPSADTAGIRLVGGWNTMLLVAAGGDCGNTLEASLLTGEDRVDERESTATSLRGLRLQASRPPGVRRTYPPGWIAVSGVDAEGLLSWTAGQEDLVGSVTYEVTSWGRGRGEGIIPPPVEVPRQPPSVDLSGVWLLTIFAPQGIQEARLQATMDQDGTLSGELQGTRLGGEIREGYVSGSEFRFLVRFDAGSRELDLIYRGIVEGDSVSGDVSFGEINEFTSRFRGERAPVAEGEVEGEAEGETEDGQGAADGEAEPAPPDEEQEPQRPRPVDRPARGERREPPPGAVPDFDAARRMFAEQQLRPPLQLGPPAPTSVELKLEAGGEVREETLSDLLPGRAQELTASLEFDGIRKAALSSSQVEFELRWGEERRRFSRELSAAGVLRSLHGPVQLRGWIIASASVGETAQGEIGGSWEVPDALSGFSLELDTTRAAGRYWLNGEALAPTDGKLILCSPCRKGQRLVIESTPAGEWEGEPAAVIMESGYPSAAGLPGTPPASEWLDALRGGGNERYLELAAEHASGT